MIMNSQIFKKFVEVTRSNSYSRYEKSLSEKIISALADGYNRNFGEPELVEIIEKVINKIDKHSVQSSNFKISTNSIFIHGNKSHVEFDYYGKNKIRELGDIIFIISLVENNKKVYEKYTINQMKKDTKNKRSLSWSLRNRPQLFLLSHFPTFKGKKGSFIPEIKYSLQNNSGCLGSYGLLYPPGDFNFVSAIHLDSFLKKRKTVNGNDLFYMQSQVDCCYRNPPPIFGNCCFALNVYDFVNKYLKFCIGEPVFSIFHNYSVSNLQFMQSIIKKIKIVGHQRKNIDYTNFADSFLKYSYKEDQNTKNWREDYYFDDANEGGLGIINTIVDLSG